MISLGILDTKLLFLFQDLRRTKKVKANVLFLVYIVFISIFLFQSSCIRLQAKRESLRRQISFSWESRLQDGKADTLIPYRMQ